MSLHLLKFGKSKRHDKKKQRLPSPDDNSITHREQEEVASSSSSQLMISLEGNNSMCEIKEMFKSKGPNDFEKIRILGVGGVGVVYLVRLVGTEKFFAMKVLKKRVMIAKNKVKRAITEREVLTTTKHPLIINLYYSFQDKSRLYFIMDYCAGGELHRILQMQPNKHFSEDIVRFYAAEVLLALEYLHAMGFIYRDLKPENILMHETGHIRLTDFDLSKSTSGPINASIFQASSSSHHHHDAPTIVVEPSIVTNSFVGTEEYFAPEVIAGEGHGASVDWWTFGIFLYEMIYGVTPFRGVNQSDTFARIKKSRVVFPDNVKGEKHVSKDCKNLIKKLLCNDPKKRLGFHRGASEIKSEPFFKDVNFQLILNTKPPIIPQLDGPTDFKYFSKRILNHVSEESDDGESDENSSKKWETDGRSLQRGPFGNFTTIYRDVDGFKSEQKPPIVPEMPTPIKHHFCTLHTSDEEFDDSRSSPQEDSYEDEIIIRPPISKLDSGTKHRSSTNVKSTKPGRPVPILDRDDEYPS